MDAALDAPRNFVDALRPSVQSTLRLLATTGAALVLVVIVSSAYLRLDQAGLSCADWPACYGRANAHDANAVTAAERTVRLAHRIAATAVGIVLLALLWIAATQRPRLKRQTALALAGLLVAAGLATLGAVLSEATPGVPLPAVTLANLTGGFALLSLLWWLRLTTLPSQLPMPEPSAGVKLLAAFAFLATICQIALGALVSAKFAALACPAFPLCGADVPDGALLSNLDPFTKLAVGAEGAIARPPTLAALHWAHRLGAHVVFAFVALLALAFIRIGRGTRRLGIVVASLIVLQLALGAGAVLAELPLTVVLAHNLVAALLLAALITANWHIHAAERAA